jgi:mono/diheme cytochrome c family protein
MTRVGLLAVALLCGVVRVGANPVSERGEQIYRDICQGCHMPDGRGARGAGTYPALAQNARLASWQYAAITVLNGRNAMPAFAPMLTDTEVADVVNYLRLQFGNRYRGRVNGAEVASLPHPRGPAARE